MKSFDLPITHNPLKTRDDVAKALLQMLKPCKDQLVLEGGGLFVGNSDAHYSSRVALMEGWSRLLWGIGPLMKGGFEFDDFPAFFEGFKHGPDPESDGYWGHVPPHDQRMVEEAAISLCLLLKKEVFFDPLSEKEKDNLASWLEEINRKPLSDNNWHFFRVLVNLALKRLGLEYDAEQMEEDLIFLESLYADDGWYHDAVPFDNYNPFAFHFYSMIYYVYNKDDDPERCERFKKRAEIFAKQYVTYFTDKGNSVPYGRSLTYRFAVSSFFAACAFADIEVLPWGVLKGIVLRNLRWWFSQPIFDSKGLLTIGYAYSSLLMAEEYNAPGSPYWSFKTFIVLALPEGHPFWTSEELPMPKLDKVTYLRMPGTLMCRTSDDDVVMLNAGQYPAFEMNHLAEKYCKFAYSADYGFSAAISNWGFDFTGCDSMLYISEGDNYWRPRREVKDVLGCKDMVRSTWSPFSDKDLVITTWLIPAGDFHVRIHKIVSKKEYVTREGGFGILHYREHELEPDVDFHEEKDLYGISVPWASTTIKDICGGRKPFWVKPRPNLNLLASTTMVPCLEGKITKGEQWYGCLTGASKKERNWKSLPKVELRGETVIIEGKDLPLI